MRGGRWRPRGGGSGGWPPGRPSPASACPSAPRRSARARTASTACAPSSTTTHLDAELLEHHAARPAGWWRGRRPPARGRPALARPRPGRRRSLRPRGASASRRTAPRTRSASRAPGALSQSTAPSISEASWREIARPSPLPPKRRVIEPSACWKRANSRALTSGAKPTPVSTTENRRRPGAVASPRMVTRALLGELHRVAGEVGEDLAHPHRVARRTSAPAPGRSRWSAPGPSRRPAGGRARPPRAPGRRR